MINNEMLRKFKDDYHRVRSFLSLCDLLMEWKENLKCMRGTNLIHIIHINTLKREKKMHLIEND